MSAPTPRTDELLPCPFCGGEAALRDLAGWEVICKNMQCGANHLSDDPSKEGAVKAWNTRSPQLRTDGELVRVTVTQRRGDDEEQILMTEEQVISLVNAIKVRIQLPSGDAMNDSPK